MSICRKHNINYNIYCKKCKKEYYKNSYISIKKTERQKEFEFTKNYIYEYTTAYREEIKERIIIAEFNGNYFRELSMKYAIGDLK
jgi:hypothetical protein